MKRFAAIFALAAPLALMACHQSASSQAVAAAPKSDSPVHTISLPRYQPDLPAGAGRDIYAGACLPCHSERYITMQPAMPAAKWEAVVRKMMATYNAPVAEEQVAPIVQYIVAAKENGDAQQWNALAVESPTSVPDFDVSHADISHGQSLYIQNCVACHGLTGIGNGSSAKVMLPHPADLTVSRMTPAAIYSAIAHGVRGAAMPAAGNLTAAEITDIVAYTLKFQPPPGETQSAVESIEALALYGTNCVSCHGHGGLGDGPAAAVAARQPANFHAKQPTADYAYGVITNGVPGTTMPAWKTKLDEKQRRSLANYVRSFYAGDVK